MPDTAKLRGLADAFNPAEALYASAAYLADLSRTYGNLGLAAVAYNGGEARADRFVAGPGGLPDETRAYVPAITGHPAETWRDAPPATVDLALEGGADFQATCVTLAANRSLREFRTEPALLPWGVVVAMNRDIAGAERQAAPPEAPPRRRARRRDHRLLPRPPPRPSRPLHLRPGRPPDPR